MAYSNDYRPDVWEDIADEEIEMHTYSNRVSHQRDQLRRLLRDASRRANMFNQSEVWVNREGRYIPLDEISARYADGIIGFLEGHAVEDAEMIFMWENRENSAAFDWDEDRCREWLRSTPLYQALEEASARPF